MHISDFKTYIIRKQAIDLGRTKVEVINHLKQNLLNKNVIKIIIYLHIVFQYLRLN